MSAITKHNRHTLRSLAAMKGKERVAMLTAYDVMTAECLDKAGIDILLVGDSVGNVVYGFPTTHAVTMPMIVAHTAAVVRGSERALVVSDLPFLSYQTHVSAAVENAGLCLANGGAQAVKLEGASPYILEVIQRLVDVGIPVMGHIGLTPQSVHQQGGYYTHGKDSASAARLLEEAQKLAQVGCFAIVLECVHAELAQKITRQVRCLTIGIGSGKVCDGEVLVVNDVLGYTRGKAPAFAPPKAQLAELVEATARKYVEEVKSV